MTDKPWVRPLPAFMLMSFVGFWASFFLRESGRDVLVAVLVGIMFASPVYYLAYALVLVIRRKRGIPGANATAVWWRLLHQAIIFLVIGMLAGISWMLLISFALVFGAPPTLISEGAIQALQVAGLYAGISMALVLPLEVIYSLVAAGKRATVV